MLDTPTVIVRSDFRTESEGPHSFNLMGDYWTRTVTIAFDPMSSFQKAIKNYKDRDGAGIYGNGGIDAAVLGVLDQYAANVVAALDEVLKTKPVLNPEMAEAAYTQFVKISGIDIQGKNQSQMVELFLTYLHEKRAKHIAASND